MTLENDSRGTFPKYQAIGTLSKKLSPAIKPGTKIGFKTGHNDWPSDGICREAGINIC